MVVKWTQMAGTDLIREAIKYLDQPGGGQTCGQQLSCETTGRAFGHGPCYAGMQNFSLFSSPPMLLLLLRDSADALLFSSTVRASVLVFPSPCSRAWKPNEVQWLGMQYWAVSTDSFWPVYPCNSRHILWQLMPNLWVFCRERTDCIFGGLNCVRDQNGKRWETNLMLTGRLESKFLFGSLTYHFVVIIHRHRRLPFSYINHPIYRWLVLSV